MERRLAAGRLATLIGPPDSAQPAYQWLADSIRQQILDGRVLHDTRLPSERDLVGALGLSRTTVTRAYDELRESGYACAKRGSGTRATIPGGPAAGGAEPMPNPGLAPNLEAEIDLSCAAPRAMPGLWQVYQDATSRLAAYTTGAGYYQHGVPELREAVAQRYRARGVPTDAEQILICAGALSASAIVFRALLGRGDRVLLETPTYPNSLATLRYSGARVAPVVSGEDAALRDGLGGARAMLWFPDFHNPTGRFAGAQEREQMARQWRAHRTLGIVDESNAELWLDEQQPDALPMAAYAPDCVSVGSLSKTVWGGLRIGWIRAPKELVGAISSARLTLDLGAPVLEQLVAAQVIQQVGGLPASRRPELRESLRIVMQLTDLGWQTEQPSGGLSVWWKLPRHTTTALIRQAASEGVALMPGSAFAIDGRGMERFVRTPFALPADELRQAVSRLRIAWAKLDQ